MARVSLVDSSRSEKSDSLILCLLGQAGNKQPIKNQLQLQRRPGVSSSACQQSAAAAAAVTAEAEFSPSL